MEKEALNGFKEGVEVSYAAFKKAYLVIELHIAFRRRIYKEALEKARMGIVEPVYFATPWYIRICNR